jgi:alpha-maltose-1-phosphate synthase
LVVEVKGRSMKILAACHRMDWTGAPIILFKLLQALAPRHEIQVLRPLDAGTGNPLESLYREAGIEVVDQARALHHDVLIGNTIMTSGKIIQVMKWLPTLWWVHEPRAGIGMIERGVVDLSAFELADLICFPTAWQSQTLYRERLASTEAVVIPYGIGPVDAAYQRPPELGAGGLHLVSLGYLSRRKGQATAIAALDQLRDPKIHLHLLGSDQTVPAQAREIRARIASSDFLREHVHVHGAQPSATVAAFLAHADALVFPTFDDLVTMSILEAMSHRLCVISSNFGPIPETVIDGETGLLFDVGDTEGLARKIALVRDDPVERARLARNGFEIAGHKHDFERHVAAMEGALEHAIETGTARIAQSGIRSRRPPPSPLPNQEPPTNILK